MTRRKFLARSSAIVGLAARACGTLAAPAHGVPQFYDQAKLYRAGISSWSFRNFFASTRSPDFREPGPAIALLDFPEIVRDRYLVSRVEFASPHFATNEPEYLFELRRKLSQARSRLVNISLRAPELDAGAGLSDRDPAIRGAAVLVVKKWIDAAHRLGSTAVSSQPGQINPGDLTPTLSSYRDLASYGRLRGVEVLIENGSGAEPGDVLDVIREVGGRSTGALPVFASFSSRGARIEGLELLFPRAGALCHAAGVSFDDEGNETAFDFQACIEIAKRYHFRGIYCANYIGNDDPYQGVQHVLNELIRYL